MWGVCMHACSSVIKYSFLTRKFNISYSILKLISINHRHDEIMCCIYEPCRQLACQGHGHIFTIWALRCPAIHNTHSCIFTLHSGAFILYWLISCFDIDLIQTTKNCHTLLSSLVISEMWESITCYNAIKQLIKQYQFLKLSKNSWKNEMELKYVKNVTLIDQHTLALY